MFALQPACAAARDARAAALWSYALWRPIPKCARWLQNDVGAQAAPVVLPRYRFGDARLALFVVIASLHAPLDTRVEHLRVAFLVPANTATEQWFRAVDAAEGCSHANQAASDTATESVRQPET